MVSRPPWIVALAVAIVVLVVTGGAVALTRDDGDDTGAAAPATTTTTQAVAETTSTTTPASTTVPSSSTTLAPGRTTTTTRATTTSTTRTSSSTTTTAAGPVPACVASMFRATVVSDRPSYRNGEVARLTATFENVSGRPCSYASNTVNSQVLDPMGRAYTPVQTLTTQNPDRIPFGAGTSQTFQSSWGVAICASATLCYPGRYTMVIDVVPFGGGRVPVDVTA
jgi:hypothetical protein